MTENLRPPQAETLTREQELYALGDLCLQSAVQLDLESAVTSHVAMTGVENPNEVAREFFIPGKEGPVMDANHAYRSVDVRAVRDLAETGVVRGAFTATNGQRKQTQGHRTFWSAGRDGVRHAFRDGQADGNTFIIKAPMEKVEAGWVTTKDVAAIYGRDSQGNAIDILKRPEPDTAQAEQ